MELLFVIFGQTPQLPHRYLSQSFGCICKLYSWPRLNIPQGAEARQAELAQAANRVTQDVQQLQTETGQALQGLRQHVQNAITNQL